MLISQLSRIIAAPAFTSEKRFRMEGSSLWVKGKDILEKKLKRKHGDPLPVQQSEFLSATTTIEQALEMGENTKKKAEGKYSGRIGRILRKMQFFARFGDIAIQHNPETTALVWAAFRMMLQVGISLHSIFEVGDMLRISEAGGQRP